MGGFLHPDIPQSSRMEPAKRWPRMRKAPQEIRTFFVTCVVNGRAPVFRRALGPQFEANACLLLKKGHDRKEVTGVRVAARAQHAH